MNNRPWDIARGLVTLRVRLTPKADRDRIDGMVQLSDGQNVLAVRVRAVPEKGAANKALIALVARALGVSRSSVSLGRGRAARIKTLTVTDTPDDVLDRLAALVE